MKILWYIWKVNINYCYVKGFNKWLLFERELLFLCYILFKYIKFELREILLINLFYLEILYWEYFI